MAVWSTIDLVDIALGGTSIYVKCESMPADPYSHRLRLTFDRLFMTYDVDVMFNASIVDYFDINFVPTAAIPLTGSTARQGEDNFDLSYFAIELTAGVYGAF